MRETIEVTVRLETAHWVGRETGRPVIRHTFKDKDGNNFSVFSTRQAIKAIALGQIVTLSAEVGKSYQYDGETFVALRKAFVTDFDAKFEDE